MKTSLVVQHLVVLVSLHFLAACAQSQQTVLVKDGKVQAALAYDANDKDASTAANELREHIKLMSGAELADATADAKQPVTIYIGSQSKLDVTPLREKTDDPAAFRLHVDDQSVHLVGLSSSGVVNAAYELLEQLGVRWYMPGEIGRVVPTTKTVSLQPQDTLGIPSFEGRHLQAVAQPVWGRRMRLGGIDTGSHGVGAPFNRETEPHLFMMENGKPTHQVDVSHPEVLQRVIDRWLMRLEKNPSIRYMRIGPEDGSGYGENKWDTGDVDPLTGEVSVTDRYIRFFNEVLKAIQKEHPNVGLGFYAYGRHMRPPVREQPNAKILPMLAPIDLCRIHTIDSPHCWERQYTRDLVDGWQAKGLKMMYRGYYFNLCNPGIPYSQTKQIAVETPYFHEKGIIGCRVQTMPCWAFHGPSLYLAAKMYWNVNLDPDALLDEYFATFYGPAGDHVQQYFEELEDAYLQSDYHTGNVFDVPHILPPSVMQQLSQHLDAAERAVASDSDEAKRVAMVRTGHHAGELILGVIDAWKKCDFVTGKKLADEARKVLKDGMAQDPPLFHSSLGIGYFNRFWGRTTDHGYTCVQGGNELVAKLPDEWLMMLDPYQAGEKLGLYKPALRDQSWRPSKTYSQSWSNQGLRYYKGDAWYRTNVTLPADAKGSPLVVWLGGVDNDPAVWLNGKPLEMSKKGASPIGRPWEFEVADTAHFDKPNVLVIRVKNDVLRELGTGGLTGPVMIYKRGE